MSKTIKGINWKLLRKQKLSLLEILTAEDIRKANHRDILTVEQYESIDGIIHLIDGIQDEAVEELSEEIVFGLNIPCSFTSEWDDGSVVTTDCVYNEVTGEVEPEVSNDTPPVGMVEEEHITLRSGKQITICPECHGYVMKTIVDDNADLSFGVHQECSDPNCIDCGE